ncbi:predicted protein [Naegleria gruberi]|uniref:Predicted protein n=1 Tax=Naegleria gruberi TaxID=5762 RepID=D2W1W6_NAEGR|nr:uncharacterized protein NAEGRDRAFT_75294 [Naegleria gruberi]EFC36936.1 predicted protein [Naegleria gruberi]|eukprot:XP_002669680.1 predicted protein [Naegleria gruberi strain NEG-M]
MINSQNSHHQQHNKNLPSSSSLKFPIQLPSSYTTAPEWAVGLEEKPKYSYHLQVIKEGELQPETIDISKQGFYVFGKQEDLSHIVCENITISRQHCIIQHAKNGRVYLYDLASANGTFWNNKKHQCKARKYIPLWLGNSFMIAMSTRSYVLSVGEEDEEAVRKLEDELKRKKTSLELEEIKKKKAEKRKKSYDSDGEEIVEDKIPEDYDANEDNRNKRLRIEDQLTSEMYEFDDREFYNSSKKTEDNTISIIDTKPTDMQGLLDKQEQIKLQLVGLRKELDKEIEMLEQQKNSSVEDEEEDELEKYMATIKTSLITQNTEKKNKIEEEIKKLEDELVQVQDLISKTKPVADKKQNKKQAQDAEIMRDRLTRDMFIQQQKPAMNSSE